MSEPLNSAERAARVFGLGGRSFVAMAESTLELDLHLVDLTRRAGISNPVLTEGEDPTAFADRIIESAIASGLLCDLLGGLLLPEGVEPRDWTPKVGRETAEHIAHLTNPVDKQAAKLLLVRFFVDFFEAGRSFLTTSATSSVQPGESESSEEGLPVTGTGTS